MRDHYVSPHRPKGDHYKAGQAEAKRFVDAGTVFSPMHGSKAESSDGTVYVRTPRGPLVKVGRVGEGALVRLSSRIRSLLAYARGEKSSSSGKTRTATGDPARPFVANTRANRRAARRLAKSMRHLVLRERLVDELGLAPGVAYQLAKYHPRLALRYLENK